MADYVYDGGGVLSLEGRKKGFDNKLVTKRSEISLSNYKQVPLSEIHCSLEDDGKPLKNEFLENIKMQEEKQKLKEQIILENYKDESYKNFVKELLEHSDDIFDSKGDDISKKEFLENEMESDWKNNY